MNVVKDSGGIVHNVIYSAHNSFFMPKALPRKDIVRGFLHIVT